MHTKINDDGVDEAEEINATDLAFLGLVVPDAWLTLTFAVHWEKIGIHLVLQSKSKTMSSLGSTVQVTAWQKKTTDANLPQWWLTIHGWAIGCLLPATWLDPAWSPIVGPPFVLRLCSFGLTLYPNFNVWSLNILDALGVAGQKLLSVWIEGYPYAELHGFCGYEQ
jgi:hypothetical protein